MRKNSDLQNSHSDISDLYRLLEKGLNDIASGDVLSEVEMDESLNLM